MKKKNITHYCSRSQLWPMYGVNERLAEELGPPDGYIAHPFNTNHPKEPLYRIEKVKEFIENHIDRVARAENGEKHLIETLSPRISEVTSELHKRDFYLVESEFRNTYQVHHRNVKTSTVFLLMFQGSNCYYDVKDDCPEYIKAIRVSSYFFKPTRLENAEVIGNYLETLFAPTKENDCEDIPVPSAETVISTDYIK